MGRPEKLNNIIQVQKFLKDLSPEEKKRTVDIVIRPQ